MLHFCNGVNQKIKIQRLKSFIWYQQNGCYYGIRHWRRCYSKCQQIMCHYVLAAQIPDLKPCDFFFLSKYVKGKMFALLLLLDLQSLKMQRCTCWTQQQKISENASKSAVGITLPLRHLVTWGTYTKHLQNLYSYRLVQLQTLNFYFKNKPFTVFTSMFYFCPIHFTQLFIFYLFCQDNLNKK